MSKKREHHKLFMVGSDAPFQFTEAYKSLRTNLEFLAATSDCKTILITSSVPGEGKSNVAVNLAITLADSGKRVVLVDCDMRKSTISRYLHIPRDHIGITNTITGKDRTQLANALVNFKDLGIVVLPVGTIPPNPSELLATKAMENTFEALKQVYDYIIVGSGLYGAIFAHEAMKAGKSCLVVERRSHIGGNIYTKEMEGIQVHQYGAHIFHTNNKKVWNYITQFAEFNRFTNSPVANYKGELYSLPFNMYTFNKMWGVVTPEEAEAKIEEQRKEITGEPKNLEEQAVSLVGRDIYEKLIKGYTEKQWGRKCTELPAFIIKRLPFRFVYDNNYFNDRYQGIPVGGYTAIVEKMLEGTEVRTGIDFFEFRKENPEIAEKIIFTGMIDEYFGYQLGALEYRSVRFETEVLDCENYQGNAVVNYTEREVPYTRIIEHKHFEFGKQEKTVISREYSSEWSVGMEPYYPVNDEKNNALFEEYKKLAEKEENVIFGGRLGDYKYYDMDKVVAAALDRLEEFN